MWRGSEGRRRRRSEKQREGTPVEALLRRERPSLEPLERFWRKRGRKVADLLILAGLLWGGAQLFLRESFFVYGVNITGNRYLSPAQVFAASRVEAMSIFYIDPHQVRADLLAEFPNLKKVVVNCSLPSYVNIAVVEYEARLVWQSGQTEYWVSQEGAFVPALERLEALTRIVDLDRQPVVPGDRIQKEILETVDWLQAHHPQLSLFEFSWAKGISYISGEGWRVYFGLSEHQEAKLAELEALREVAEKQGLAIEYVDLNIPRRLYCKYGAKPLPKESAPPRS